jgi:hypothetical protein
VHGYLEEPDDRRKVCALAAAEEDVLEGHGEDPIGRDAKGGGESA